MAFPSGFSLTWFGHSTYLVQLPNGKRLLFDPFIKGNPACPADKKDLNALRPLDALLISHGHGDHFSDAIEVATLAECTVVAIFEIVTFMAARGVKKFEPMNKGGSIRLADVGVTVTATHAFHSSSIGTEQGDVYAGEPMGYVVTLDDGFSFYFAGDTALFSDMALIGDLYRPRLAFLPIGDRFTMGPREAAKAVTLLPDLEAVIPIHYGTFSLLTGTPDALREELKKLGSSVKVLAPAPGETITL